MKTITAKALLVLLTIAATVPLAHSQETPSMADPAEREKWPHWPLMVQEIPEDWPQEEEGPADSAPSGLYAGVASTDISPAYGIPLMMWGSAVHVESDGLDPSGMHARALVLSDGEQQFAMVDIDIVSVDRFSGLVERIAARTGIPEENIRLAASHTHASPGVNTTKGPPGIDLHAYEPLVERHRNAMYDKISGVVLSAQTELRPVHMYGDRGTAEINVNRRFRGEDGTEAVGVNPDGFVDQELVVFRIDDASGKPYAVLFNYQAHPTIMAYANTKISPDYVGMARHTVESALPGATALFFQGAAGDQGPIEGFTGDLDVAHRLGQILGHETAAIALGIETVQRSRKFEGYMESTAYQAKQHWRVEGPRDQTLQSVRRIIEVPGRRIAPEDMRHLEEQLSAAREAAARFNEDNYSAAALQSRARLRRYSDRHALWQGFINRTEPVMVELRALRIGNLAIVSMPGEPFSRIGHAIKEASPFAFTMFAGYSSGVGRGYMPTAEEYDLGGYEVVGTRYGEGAAEEVIRAATEMLNDLR
ncbi:MAG: neutral/alkaline non-lysosomal ceramidase N-terminal domain-containing protein [Porticoccaceae bacterium]